MSTPGSSSAISKISHVKCHRYYNLSSLVVSSPLPGIFSPEQSLRGAGVSIRSLGISCCLGSSLLSSGTEQPVSRRIQTFFSFPFQHRIIVTIGLTPYLGSFLCDSANSSVAFLFSMLQMIGEALGYGILQPFKNPSHQYPVPKHRATAYPLSW